MSLSNILTVNSTTYDNWKDILVKTISAQNIKGTTTMFSGGTYTKAWNPAVADSITIGTVSGFILNINLNTTALLGGYNSDTLTIHNSLVIPSSVIIATIHNYSGLPTTFTAGGASVPVIIVRSGSTGFFGFQIVSDGFSNMGANDTIVIHFFIC